MDRIEKLFQRISKKDRCAIELALAKIFSGDFSGLDKKRLRKFQYIYRVRVGDYRIIYYHKDNEIILKAIRRRDEKTYGDF